MQALPCRTCTHPTALVLVLILLRACHSVLDGVVITPRLRALRMCVGTTQGVRERKPPLSKLSTHYHAYPFSRCGTHLRPSAAPQDAETWDRMSIVAVELAACIHPLPFHKPSPRPLRLRPRCVPSWSIHSHPVNTPAV